jgi:type IV pilus secretin PilQ/predicted competence protein
MRVQHMRRHILATVVIGSLIITGAFDARKPAGAQETAPAAVPAAPGQPAPAAPGPTITALGVTKDPQGTTITIHGDGDLPYEYTTIEGKNLVIEIPGAGTKVWPATQQLDDPFVSRVQIGEQLSPKKLVRVVFDLKTAAAFTVRGDGPRIVAAFGAPAGKAASAAAEAETAAPAPRQAAPAEPPSPGRLNRVSGLQFKLVDGTMHVDVLADAAPDYQVLETDDPRVVTILVTNARIEPAAQKVDDLTAVNELVAKVTALQEKSIPPTVKLLVELRQPAPVHVSRIAGGLRIAVSPGRGHGATVPAAAPATAPPVPPPAAAPRAADLSREPAVDVPSPVERTAKSYAGRRITVDFVDAELKDIFQPIAEVSGLNIIFGDEVKGRRTLQLHDVQWDQALDMILKTNNPPLTTIEEANGILRITTLERVLQEGMEVEKKKQTIQSLADQKAKTDAAARIQEVTDLRELEKARKREEIIGKGLVEKTFLISYASVETITTSINKLTDQYSKIFSSSQESVSAALLNQQSTSTTSVEEKREKGRTQTVVSRSAGPPLAALQMSYDACPGCLTEVDGRTNTIFIRTYPYYLDQFAAIIAALDKPTPSIMVEARIVEVQNDYTQNLGIQWGANFVADPAHGNAPPYEFPNSVTMGGTVKDTTGTYLVNLPAAGAMGGLGFTLGNIANTFSLDLRLSALESLGKTKILSNPKLLVLQSEKARIQIGEQLPMTLSDVTETSTTSTVSWKDVGIILEVTPRVTYDNRVNMEVLIEKSSKGVNVVTTQGENFSVVTNKASTKVLIENGSTAVIGGLFTQTAVNGSEGIPGLAQLPFVGWLFKSKSDAENRKELLIFLTPRIIADAAGATNTR